MAKVIWKSSILDTYNGNDKFGGREGETVKGIDKAAGVDFLKQLYNGVESVEGFKTNKNPFDHTPTDFNMVNTTKKAVNTHFEPLSTNTGFTMDGGTVISTFNNNKTYRNTNPK